MTIRRAAALIGLFVYVLFILDLVLLQFPSSHPPTNLRPLHSIIADWRTGGREFAVNFVGNLVAFMPIGLIPPLARPRRTTARHVAFFCFGLSAIIEVGQYISGRRVADVDDLILNTIGGLLGYFLLVIGQWSIRARVGALTNGTLSSRVPEKAAVAKIAGSRDPGRLVRPVNEFPS